MYTFCATDKLVVDVVGMPAQPVDMVTNRSNYWNNLSSTVTCSNRMGWNSSRKRRLGVLVAFANFHANWLVSTLDFLELRMLDCLRLCLFLSAMDQLPNVKHPWRLTSTKFSTKPFLSCFNDFENRNFQSSFNDFIY